jgi:hypothetical protein
MSKIQVNAIEPQCGTTLTVGASGDTIVIPSGATISNQGTAAGFGPTGAVSWNTTKITANPNPAVTGVGYFADTTSAAFTITLPATPAAGAVVGIADYANTFATNNLTVGRNSSNIGGVANNAILSTNGLSVTFVYVDATQGWIVTDSGNRSDLPVPQFIAATGGTVTCCGNYKIHTFTGPGTFTVTSAGNASGSNSVDYLVVAGGGGAGSSCIGGGGGAGGFRASATTFTNAGPGSPRTSCVSALPVSVQGYPIIVGAGGPAGVNNPNIPTNIGTPGVNSSFSTITSAGGAGGGGNPIGGTGGGLAGGGSGGGGSGGNGIGSAGNTPPVAPPQGNSGGAGAGSPVYGAGGGGGAMTAGGAGSPTSGGAGGAGAGLPTAFGANGVPSGGYQYYAGGGGGAGEAPTSTGAGGIGGGGNGGFLPTPINGIGGSGIINTGGGGGGTCGPIPASPLGASGGSGIVVIRYKFQ